MHKTVILSVRILPVESLKLQQYAAEAGLTVSRYTRAVLFEKVPERGVNPIVAHDLAQLCVSLDREGLHEHAERLRAAIRDLAAG
jgi:hypothetical protein